jgi:DNA replication protein DnaC
MTSQVPTKAWHEHLADQALADPILDRLLNNAHKIVTRRSSRRRQKQEGEK